MMTPRTQLIAGMRAVLPIMLGVVPFGLVAGVAAIEVGLSPELALGMSLIVFAGASQLAALQLIAAQASPFIIFLTAAIINLRMVMYSATLAPHFKQLTLSWKALLAYLLTDPPYAISIMYFHQNEDAPHKPYYYLGACSVAWVTWQISTLVGIFLGTQIPSSLGLDFIIPLIFISLVTPSIKDKSNIAVAIVAGIMSIIAFDLPFNLGLLVAACIGIIVGLITDYWTSPITEATD